MSSAPERLEGEVEAAGHFRIYLGAMAGVGKTCAMLEKKKKLKGEYNKKAKCMYENVYLMNL
jgi:K+-sensing histidine kinase KdpD